MVEDYRDHEGIMPEAKPLTDRSNAVVDAWFAFTPISGIDLWSRIVIAVGVMAFTGGMIYASLH